MTDVIARRGDLSDVDALVDQLSNLDMQMVDLAYSRLNELGDSAFPVLRRVVADHTEPTKTRQFAAVKLIRGNDRRSRRILSAIARNHDEDSGLRLEIAKDFVNFGSTWGAPMLTRMLDDPDDEVRLMAIRAVGYQGNPGVLPALQRIEDTTALTEFRDAAHHSTMQIRKRHRLHVADADDPTGPVILRAGSFHVHRVQLPGYIIDPPRFRVGIDTHGGDIDLGDTRRELTSRQEVVEVVHAWLARQPAALEELRAVIKTDPDPRHIAAARRGYRQRTWLVKQVQQALEDHSSPDQM